MSDDAALDLRVRRDDLSACEVVPAPGADAALEDGEVLLAVDAFALTANNVTYAVMGDAMGYWRFFPASEGWGRVPVWGFADVLRSAHPGVAEGARVYGFLPMSTHLRVRAGEAGTRGFSDLSAHRAGLSRFYNEYLLTAADPAYDPAREAEQMLLRPLFATGFLIDDQLAEQGFLGAARVVLSSASSKTAYAAAFGLAAREGIEVVGLTSAGHRDFVAGLGCYDRALAYEEAATLADGVATVYVDLSGSAAVRSALHHALGDDLRRDLIVGASHHRELAAGQDELPGPAPQLFFAPAQLERRIADWGAAGFQQRLAAAWDGFLGLAERGALQVVRDTGPQAVRAAWRDLVAGDVAPHEGHVATLRRPHA